MSAKSSGQTRGYREMSQELDIAIEKFNSPDIDIEESTKLYETALKLIKEIENYLTKAENKIKQLNKKN